MLRLRRLILANSSLFSGYTSADNPSLTLADASGNRLTALGARGSNLGCNLCNLFGKTLTDKNDPMYIMANAFCMMSDDLGSQIGNLATHVEGMRTEIIEVRSEQTDYGKRISALERRKTEDVSRAVDAGTAAITRAKQCEPFSLIFTDFPLVREELICGGIVDVGAYLGFTFGPNYVKSTRRGSPGFLVTTFICQLTSRLVKMRLIYQLLHLLSVAIGQCTPQGSSVMHSFLFCLELLLLLSTPPLPLLTSPTSL